VVASDEGVKVPAEETRDLEEVADGVAEGGSLILVSGVSDHDLVVDGRVGPFEFALEVGVEC
jgi:hypothetical protein